MQPDFASTDAVVQDVDQAPAVVVPPPMIRPGNTFELKTVGININLLFKNSL